jgi:hypothetical protein
LHIFQYSPCMLLSCSVYVFSQIGFHVLCLVGVLLQLTFCMAMAQVSCVLGNCFQSSRKHDAGRSFNILVVSRFEECLCICILQYQSLCTVTVFWLSCHSPLCIAVWGCIVGQYKCTLSSVGSSWT